MKLMTIPLKSYEGKGELQKSWGEIPDDDLEVVANKRHVLVNMLHPRCGIDRDDAESRSEYLPDDP